MLTSSLPPECAQTPLAAHPPNRVPTRAATVVASFGYAFAGVRHLLCTQRNAQIHSFFGSFAVILGFLLQIGREEWLVLLLTIGLVFTAEGVNTAIEAVVDLASPDYHPLAKVAKDVAAGTVLLAAITALVIGLVLFIPHLLPLLNEVIGL